MNPFPVLNLTKSTLNIPPNTYSLQDAFNPNGFDSTQDTNGYTWPYLFNTGCQYHEVQNCTAVCQDSGSAFSTLETLHNCMMYPIIADQYAKNNLSTDIAQMANSLGIEKGQWPSIVSYNITKTIGTCLDAYCNSNSLPGCNTVLQMYNESAHGAHQTTFKNFTGSFYYDTDPFSLGTLFDLCSYLPASVNQDIGGIGVYVSFWIQTGISLLAFCMIVWWRWVAYPLSLSVFALSPKVNMQARAQRIRAKGRTVRLDALTSALVEFHKAQCFFVLAIDIAAQVDRTKGGLQPESLQQLYNTWVLIKSISIGGYLPVTFTLFNLHLVDLVSWYLLSLTICTVAVSIATLIAIGNFNPSDADIRFLNTTSSTNGPTACGERTPGAWCYKPVSLNYYSNDPSNGAYSMLGFCVFVLFLLMAKQLGADNYLPQLSSQRKVRKRFPKIKHMERWYSKGKGALITTLEVFRTVQQKILDHRKARQLRRSCSSLILSWKHLSQRMLSWRGLSWTQSDWFTKVTESANKDLTILRLFIVLFYATIIGLYLHFFKIFCQDLAWFASNGVSNTWSFGQIVAITVWAGPLCEYIHLETRGMKRGFLHRLPAPYKVVKGNVKGNGSTSDEEGADKGKAEDGEELAFLSAANSSAIQPYPSSATNSVNEQVNNLDRPENERLVEMNDSTNSGYDRVEHQEEFMLPEVNPPEVEEDITMQMSNFSGPETLPLFYA